MFIFTLSHFPCRCRIEGVHDQGREGPEAVPGAEAATAGPVNQSDQVA